MNGYKTKKINILGRTIQVLYDGECPKYYVGTFLRKSERPYWVFEVDGKEYENIRKVSDIRPGLKFIISDMMLEVATRLNQLSKYSTRFTPLGFPYYVDDYKDDLRPGIEVTLNDLMLSIACLLD